MPLVLKSGPRRSRLIRSSLNCSSAIHRPVLLQIHHARPRTQLFQQTITAVAFGEPGDFALRVAQVAEDQDLGGARLLTRGLDLTVLDRALLILGSVLCAADPLNTEGALLHDAAGAHRHVRVELLVQGTGP